MQDPESLNYLESFLQFILLPASLYGAGGALMHSTRKGRTLGQAVIEVVGGVVTANMVCPLIQAETPAQWHYTLFFLVGWGGLELVGNWVIRSALAQMQAWQGQGLDMRLLQAGAAH